MQRLSINRLLLALACSCLISHTQAKAEFVETSGERPPYNLPLSVSLDLYESQDPGTDLSVTFAELHGALDNFLNTTDYLTVTILNAAILRPFIGFNLALLTHEIIGHGVRAYGLGQPVTGIYIGLLQGYVSYNPDPETASLVTEAIISLGGNEASFDYSQKIKKRVLLNRLTPAYAAAYTFSAGNQCFYVYVKSSEPGHDLESYSEHMQMLYGRDYITMEKIRSVGFIDLLDPVTAYSLYSLFTNTDFDAPMIPIGPVKFLPSLRLILTPYGIEKQLCIDSKIGDSILKLAVSIGDTRIIAEESIQEYSQFCNNYRKFDSNIKNHFHYEEPQDPSSSEKNGKPLPPQNFENWSIDKTTFGVKCEIDNLQLSESITSGVLIALWKQPELFGQDENMKYIDPLLAKISIGGMIAANVAFRVHENFALGMQAGYKTFGYTNGYNMQPAFILKITLNLIF